jgi:hypothetical protein
MFQGKVIDQEGNPVDGAVIVGQISKLVPSRAGDAVGSVVPDRLPNHRFSTSSGHTGMFYVMMKSPNNDLEILDIKKDGYKWVIDWAWQLGPKYDEGNNTDFKWDGKYWHCPVYQTVPDSPAIFPMHQIGNPKPATRPSRGGKDLLCNKKTRINHPMPLQIPSAGPAAPQTAEEIDSRQKEFSKAKVSRNPRCTRRRNHCAKMTIPSVSAFTGCDRRS